MLNNREFDVMKCPICRREQDTDAIYCTGCGQKIPRCPTCGAVLYQRCRFCETDGTPLPEELFAGLPPEQATPAPSVPPPPAPKAKKSRAPVLAVILAAVLLLAAAGGGAYYFLRDRLSPSDGGKDGPASSFEEDARDSGDEDRGQAGTEDPAAAALDEAADCASAGDYEGAFQVLRDALEEDPDADELEDALTEYIDAFETEALHQAEALVERDGHLAALRSLWSAAEKLGQESPRLSGRAQEYEELYITGLIAQADRLASEERFEEALTALDDAAALFPENAALQTRRGELEERTAQAGSAAAITADAVITAEASSYLSQPKLDLYHTAGRTLDGDLTTAWVEGASGDGVGEWITFTFDGVYRVSGMRIHAGYQKSEELYGKNARPAILTVVFSDGTEQTVTLQDINGPQDVAFDGPADTSSVTLEIASVYPGSKYEDTVISEVSFY